MSLPAECRRRNIFPTIAALRHFATLLPLRYTRRYAAADDKYFDILLLSLVTTLPGEQDDAIATRAPALRGY